MRNLCDPRNYYNPCYKIPRNRRSQFVETLTWGFPKIGSTLLGVPIIRIIVFWALHRGPLILGNYHMD